MCRTSCCSGLPFVQNLRPSHYSSATRLTPLTNSSGLDTLSISTHSALDERFYFVLAFQDNCGDIDQLRLQMLAILLEATQYTVADPLIFIHVLKLASRRAIYLCPGRVCAEKTKKREAVIYTRSLAI